MNSIYEEASGPKLREVTANAERLLGSVPAQYGNVPVDTLHLLTVCVDDPKQAQKCIAANHKVQRVKGSSGASETVLTITIPLLPHEVNSGTTQEVLRLYLEALYRQLHKADLKLPQGFSLDPLIARVHEVLTDGSAL